MDSGCLPEIQGAVTASTTTPSMEVPCPPIHMVTDLTTMSAPWAMGVHT